MGYLSYMYKPGQKIGLSISPEPKFSVFTLLAWSIHREGSLDFHAQVSLHAFECASDLRFMLRLDLLGQILLRR
jgi:hypothetical protein